MKRCYRCKEEKPLDSFNKDKRQKDGHRSACRECSRLQFKKFKESQNYQERIDRYKIARATLKKTNPKKRWATIVFYNSKKRADESNLQFNINREWVYKNAPEFCPVLKMRLNYANIKSYYDSPSIDRFDNSKGYTTDNCTIISMRANKIKNDATTEEVKKVYEWMSKKVNPYAV